MHKQHEPKKEQAAPLVCTKELYKEPEIPRRIKQISFGLQNPQEIVKCGVFPVYERGLYKMPERVPLPNGVLDKRLGVSNKTASCETCGQKLAECEGHFGYIRLELPVFHVGYFRNTLQLLQCICKSCARVLLPDDERRVWLKRFRSPRLERVQREGLFKKVILRCKRQKICPYCGEFNGTVKKATGALKISHEKYAKNVSALDALKDQLFEAMQHNEQLKGLMHRAADDLNPLRVMELFTKIPSDDCDVLDITGRPENLIVTHLAVPPVAIRPSVDMDGTSNEDDITIKLMQIIEVNGLLRQGLEKGLPVSGAFENWDFLQMNCALLINSDVPGLPPEMKQPGRPLRGFVQRLKGKQGRFRGNLSGKRVDFSGRTVISPDPNLQINQVCVPQHQAVVLTYPERVTKYNIDKLKQRVLNGVGVWPGANFVAYGGEGGGRWFLKFGDRRKIAAELKVGDVVERHLEDGDVVLFNRQPSLHRISIMAFRAKVRPWRTLRFNECVCSPFNADFDGDEMNLHLPQTEESRAEAIQLMGSVNNLCTPKNGEILIAATQDFLTCAFLVTSKDKFFSRAELSSLSSYMSDGLEHVDVPPPAVMKPMELWTGKQLFSLLVRPNTATRIFLNLEMPEKIYSKKGEHMCVVDGYVAFRNSVLLCGRIGKGILGGTKGGLFSTLNSDYSPMAAAAVMSRLAKMAARYMGNRGFSIGIDDVTPKDKLLRAKASTLEEGYFNCQHYIKQYKAGRLELQPGCNPEQTLEAQVTGVLNNIREIAGKVCMETLHWHNSPLIMSQCGSKGSPINIAQMVACVGQQSVGGKRAFNGFTDRTLPHYPRGDKTPAGKGFVANSFYSGLTATEFWFHTMGGREGLVDTAVKTAETGYMSRRLMKALEDLYVHYDMTVRSAAGSVVQLVYGDDGMDPLVMEGGEGKPLDLERVLAKVRATVPRQSVLEGGQQEVALPAALDAAVDASLLRPELKKGSGWCSDLYRDTYAEFVKKQVCRYRAARERVGLPADERGEGSLEYLAGLEGLTQAQLEELTERVVRRYDVKRIEPGAPVGAVGAQSIGEPGTQMTLKTFHFAGVASMNVTLGVPRIKEIINGARNISTPIMKVALAVDNDVKSARIVKGRLEKTTLGQVAEHVRVVLKPGFSQSLVRGGGAYISIRLDMCAVEALQLDVDALRVKSALLGAPKLKLKEAHIRVVAADKLIVSPPDEGKQGLLFVLEQLLASLPQVIVAGIPSVERAVISAGKDGKYTLLVEGTNLQAVMATQGVLGHQTVTNHVHEVERFLGIEAARVAIMSEIKYTMGSHGMSIDDRHTMLLADCMTYKGEVLGITRFGIAKMKDSVLHTASFERTADHLFDAAIHGRQDDVVGVSESIIMGLPMPAGTGIFRLRQSTPAGAAALGPVSASLVRSLPHLSEGEAVKTAG